MKKTLIANLHKEFTFENFVVGEENKFAYQIALKTVEFSGASSPIYLEGESTGVGVTHLLQAMAWKLEKEHPEKNYMFFDSDGFTATYIASLKHDTFSSLQKKYLDTDIILIDGMQGLARKHAIQNELCKLFDKWSARGIQLVFGGAGLHKDSEFRDELVSRLESGVIAMLKPPGYILRKKILTKITQKSLIPFEDNALNLIAENITGSVRKLNSVCSNLGIQALQTSKPVTVKMVNEVGRRYFDRINQSKERPTFPALCKIFLDTELPEWDGGIITEDIYCRYGFELLKIAEKLVEHTNDTSIAEMIYQFDFDKYFPSTFLVSLARSFRIKIKDLEYADVALEKAVKKATTIQDYLAISRFYLEEYKDREKAEDILQQYLLICDSVDEYCQIGDFFLNCLDDLKKAEELYFGPTSQTKTSRDQTISADHLRKLGHQKEADQLLTKAIKEIKSFDDGMFMQTTIKYQFPHQLSAYAEKMYGYAESVNELLYAVDFFRRYDETLCPPVLKKAEKKAARIEDYLQICGVLDLLDVEWAKKVFIKAEEMARTTIEYLQLISEQSYFYSWPGFLETSLLKKVAEKAIIAVETAEDFRNITKCLSNYADILDPSQRNTKLAEIINQSG